MKEIRDLVKGWQKVGMSSKKLAHVLKTYLGAVEEKTTPFFLEGLIREAECEYDRIKLLIEFLDVSKKFFRQEKQRISKEKEAYKMKLGAILAAQFPQIKIKGQLPKLQAGLLTLEFILSRNEVKVWYGPQYELLTRVNLTKVDLATLIKEVYSQLEKNGQKGDALITSLWQAYKLSLKELETHLGTPISLKVLFPHLVWLQQKKQFWLNPKRQGFKEYSWAQLSFDLFRTQERLYQDLGFRLIVATREQTKNKADFLWVPANWQGDGYCFRAIAFKKLAESNHKIM
jgi:Holliday junction resolvase RusA-like endonuclease